MFLFRKTKTTKIISFGYVRLHMSGMRSSNDYEIVKKDGAAEICEYQYRCVENGFDRVPVRRAVCGEDEVLGLLNDCGIYGWNGFHGKHPKHVCDGTAFTFEAGVNDGDIIKADGSENFPPHFRDLTNGLYGLLKDSPYNG